MMDDGEVMILSEPTPTLKRSRIVNNCRIMWLFLVVFYQNDQLNFDAISARLVCLAINLCP